MNANIAGELTGRGETIRQNAMPKPMTERLDCPNCGELRSDRIVWIDAETVCCSTCDHRFAVWADREIS